MLLLLPQRNIALAVVSRLLELAVKETRSDTIRHKQRFLDEFGDGGEGEVGAGWVWVWGGVCSVWQGGTDSC